jgi:hypothetical protein
MMHHHAPHKRVAGMLPLRAAGHLRELRLQIRKAGGCLATIESGTANRSEIDAARVAFHRHAEAIAHTMILFDSAPLVGQLSGATVIDVLVKAIEIAVEDRDAALIEGVLAEVDHG